MSSGNKAFARLGAPVKVRSHGRPAARASQDRLAGISGAAATPAGGSALSHPPRGNLEPDVSRIRPLTPDETPEARKKRLAAKTVNFTATILARLIILAGAGLYIWKSYDFSGQLPRTAALGLFAMTADLGRVALKALEPGGK